MKLKLYCNRYTHFKNSLVCAVSCVYRTRCRDFALFYDEHRAEIDANVGDYYSARRESIEAQSVVKIESIKKAATKPNVTAFDDAYAPYPLRTAAKPLTTVADIGSLVRLEVKRQMSEAAYIWISKDDQAEVLELEEVIRRAEHGAKAKSIYKVAQEMELRFQLVPRRGIEKAKRAAAAATAVAAARAAARIKRPRLIETDADATPTVAAVEAGNSLFAAETPIAAAAPPRRTRAPRVAKAASGK